MVEVKRVRYFTPLDRASGDKPMCICECGVPARTSRRKAHEDSFHNGEPKKWTVRVRNNHHGIDEVLDAEDYFKLQNKWCPPKNAPVVADSDDDDDDVDDN